MLEILLKQDKTPYNAEVHYAKLSYHQNKGNKYPSDVPVGATVSLNPVNAGISKVG